MSNVALLVWSAQTSNAVCGPVFSVLDIHSINKIVVVVVVVACLQAFTAGGFIAENPFRSVIERHLGFLRRALPGTSGRVQKSREAGRGREEKNRLLENQLPLSSSPATMARPPTCHTLLIEQQKSMTLDQLSITLKTNSRAARSSLLKFWDFQFREVPDSRKGFERLAEEIS